MARAQLYDLDNSGTINLAEMVEAYKQSTNLYGKRGAGMADRATTLDIEQIMDSVDKDKNKTLDFNEFVLLLADVFVT